MGAVTSVPQEAPPVLSLGLLLCASDYDAQCVFLFLWPYTMSSQGILVAIPELPHIAWPELLSETLEQAFLNP